MNNLYENTTSSWEEVAAASTKGSRLIILYWGLVRDFLNSIVLWSFASIKHCVRFQNVSITVVLLIRGFIIQQLR